jgi:hypothetical protein
VNSLVVVLCVEYGLTARLGVRLTPHLSLAWLYPRIVWGGIWGVLFLLPLTARSALKTGLILSLGPSLAQLFVVFPYKAGKGMMGLELGTMTPLLVLFFNAFWGVAAAFWMKLARG